MALGIMNTLTGIVKKILPGATPAETPAQKVPDVEGRRKLVKGLVTGTALAGAGLVAGVPAAAQEQLESEEYGYDLQGAKAPKTTDIKGFDYLLANAAVFETRTKVKGPNGEDLFRITLGVVDKIEKNGNERTISLKVISEGNCADEGQCNLEPTTRTITFKVKGDPGEEVTITELNGEKTKIPYPVSFGQFSGGTISKTVEGLFGIFPVTGNPLVLYTPQSLPKAQRDQLVAFMKTPHGASLQNADREAFVQTPNAILQNTNGEAFLRQGLAGNSFLEKGSGRYFRSAVGNWTDALETQRAAPQLAVSR